MTQVEERIAFIGGPLSGRDHRNDLPNPFFYEDGNGNQVKYIRQQVATSPYEKIICYIDATRTPEQARAIIQELFT